MPAPSKTIVKAAAKARAERTREYQTPISEEERAACIRSDEEYEAEWKRISARWAKKAQ